VSEAHPDDEWQMESNRKDKVVFKQPKSFAERLEAAKILVERLHYKAPVAIDSMDNLADTAYSAWPERLYVIAPGGRIVYKGGMGPFEFKPEEAEKALGDYLAKNPPQVLPIPSPAPQA
jgi:iodothyronine deiodinase-like protein